MLIQTVKSKASNDRFLANVSIPGKCFKSLFKFGVLYSVPLNVYNVDVYAN